MEAWWGFGDLMKIKKSELEKFIKFIGSTRQDLTITLSTGLDCPPKHDPCKKRKNDLESDFCYPCWQKYFDKNLED